MNDYHELLQEENMELLRANPLQRDSPTMR